MTIGTKLFTWWKGAFVGTDEFGNRYYGERGRPRRRRPRRWVLYAGESEASRVPPEWHTWLHYTVDEPPAEGGAPARPWQKPHRPNLTGTAEAYRPSGHEYRGGRRARGAYEPWRPT